VGIAPGSGDGLGEGSGVSDGDGFADGDGDGFAVVGGVDGPGSDEGGEPQVPSSAATRRDTPTRNRVRIHRS
jgi:hypothetical protein